MSKKVMRDQARTLRHNGTSVRDIAKMLNISTSTVSIWVRDILLTDEQVKTLKANQRLYGAQNSGANSNRDNARKMRLSFQEEGRVVARENRPLHLAGCMLYWAEGAKHRNKLYFVNSDPNMMLFFMRFLREELRVDDATMAVHIHCHSSDPVKMQRIEQYWLNLLGLPQSCLKKTQVKKGSEIRINKLENGVCGIGVYRTELTQHVYGAIQEYTGLDNPEWLF